VIPGNDDSQKTIKFFSNAVADAIIDGMQYADNTAKEKAANTKEDIKKS
jgi:ribosomal protein S2